MNDHNRKAVEFFLSNFRLGDVELREKMVTPNFKFITPILGSLSFSAYNNYVTIMRNHTHVQMGKITQIDNQNFMVNMDYTLVDNSANYVQEFTSILNVKFIKNSIDSLTLSYDIPKQHQEKFIELMKPFYADLVK